MPPTVLLQQRNGGGDWSPNVAVARSGFEHLGYALTVDESLASKCDVAVGSVRFVRRSLLARGLDPPCLNTLPEQLSEFYGRRVWRTTLGAIRQEDLQVFIKPIEDTKLFTGHVRGDPTHLAATATLPDETPVLASDPIDLEAEWRCFICHGECVGIRQYLGPVFAPKPPPSFVSAMVLALGPQSPAGYSLDVGLLAGGQQPVLVEMNDGYGLSAYGLEPVLYAKLLEARFLELSSSANA